MHICVASSWRNTYFPQLYAFFNFLRPFSAILFCFVQKLQIYLCMSEKFCNFAAFREWINTRKSETILRFIETIAL